MNDVYFTITELNDENINDLYTLYKLFIEETGAFMPLNLKKNIKEFLKSKTSGIYISYSNDIPTGFVEYRLLENKLRDDEGVIEITSLFTHKDYRKSGIAKELIKKIEAISLKSSCTRIVLYSGLELKDAHKFYKQIGFKKKAYYFAKNLY